MVATSRIPLSLTAPLTLLTVDTCCGGFFKRLTVTLYSPWYYTTHLVELHTGLAHRP